MESFQEAWYEILPEFFFVIELLQIHRPGQSKLEGVIWGRRTEGCGNGKSLVSQGTKNLNLWWSHQRIHEKCDRIVGEEWNFTKNFWFFPEFTSYQQKASVENTDQWLFRKNSRNYGNEVMTAASSCVLCWGNPGFVQKNVLSWLTMRVVAHFLGSTKLRCQHFERPQVHGRHVISWIMESGIQLTQKDSGKFRKSQQYGHLLEISWVLTVKKAGETGWGNSRSFSCGSKAL